MRKFSEFEKECIRYIVNLSRNNLSFVLVNAYNDIFYREKIEYKINTTHLKFYRDIDNVSVDEILSIEKEIVIKSLLIKYLVDNRYIFLVNDTTSDQDITLGNFLKDGLIPFQKDISPEISEVLSYSALNRIFVSFDLVYLVENGFRTIEDEALEESRKQTEKAGETIKLSGWAIFISSVSILVAILVPICYNSTIKVDYNQEKRILIKDSLRNRDIINHLESIETKIESIQIIKKSHNKKRTE